MELYTAVEMPMASVQESRISVFMMPLARPCCFGGRDCITYICKLQVRLCNCEANLQGCEDGETYVGDVELEISAHNIQDERREHESPVVAALF